MGAKHTPGPWLVFDSAMKLGYDNAFDVLVDIQESQNRRALREAEEVFAGSSAGLSEIIQDERFTRKVQQAASARDRTLTQVENDRASAIAAEEQRHRDTLERIARASGERRAEAFRTFEVIQRAEMSFTASQLYRAARKSETAA